MPPFVGEIRMFGGNFAPAGWALCQGQTLPISENETLFTLIGTTYGGDGQNTFNLPDLRGRLPVHQGSGFALGQMAGAEQVALTTAQVPAHSHPLLGANATGNQINPGGNVPANSYNVTIYTNGSPSGNMNAGAILGQGASQPHENRQPYLCINFIISLFGVYPSQS